MAANRHRVEARPALSGLCSGVTTSQQPRRCLTRSSANSANSATADTHDVRSKAAHPAGLG
ncbi:hypothetical protein [Goodfellowiella coeruleoviolacea]|uniref:Uncharacterized protein n=1 Tax=Goodfellowiella coeruleoviolacea TaxID=334858 RepID=A0AAE3GDQ2_9PSEU|nr:hypothetical protein [Goodfellowiella coeruleoviolacea]MCP2166367.1 hypothetical protein [Goodfellowiella coeruleoviolacea]